MRLFEQQQILENGGTVPFDPPEYIDYMLRRWRNYNGTWQLYVPWSDWNPTGAYWSVAQFAPTSAPPIDLQPYRYFVADFVSRHMPDPIAYGDYGGWPDWSTNNDFLTDPYMYDLMLQGNPVTSLNANPANHNPYVTTSNRDVLRAFAVSLGLTWQDADRIAFDVANQQFMALRQPYSEATAPAVIGDEIAHRIAGAAGVVYTGLTPEEKQAAVDQATNIQENMKGHREAAQDASMWTNAVQAISVVLPVVGYYAGIGAAAASEAAGASTAVEVGADYTAGAAAGGITSSAATQIVQNVLPMTQQVVDAPTKTGLKADSLNPLSLPFGDEERTAARVADSDGFRNTIILGSALLLLKLLLAKG